MSKPPPSSLLLLLLSLLFPALSYGHRQVYIVYLGEHSGIKTTQEIHKDHHSYLLSVKNSEEEARGSLLYSYKNSINGFAALLSEEEAAKLSEMEEVVSAFPSKERSWSLHTTRSWEFIGQEEGLMGSEKDRMPSKAKYGKDIIVGMLDSGIWPESKSFRDYGMGPIPKQWKGICEEGDNFTSSNCNKKLIGARYYLKAYEAYHGPLNTSYAYRSPRDLDGHGTHTSSTVGGRVVHGVSALGGFAHGTASGGAPLTRLAIYKVCWPIPGPNPNIENTCFEADMLAAIDDAIGDGVDVLSISIGSVGKPPKYSQDGIAIGALHAVKRNVVVVCSGGNSGPTQATVSNLAPWIITVGASSIDRAFDSPVILGNNKIIEGQTVTPYTLKGKLLPVVYAGDVAVPGTPSNVTGQCLPNSLSPEKVRGKIVVCLRGSGMRVAKGMEVKRAGGAAIILGNALANGNEVIVDAHVLPGTAVSSDNAIDILKYINSTSNPTATIGKAKTVLGIKSMPIMAAFSSRGPNPVEPNILKPDITAPGMNILAAWSDASSPTKLEDDHRSVKYNLMSGTSMSCPHVSATAALLKSIHPQWSSAAIRSAMMTTATVTNTNGGPLMNAAGEVAGPLEYGSGHLRPTHASDPGLVYDTTFTDYLLFACASINVQMDPTFPCPKAPPSTSNLNHPSLAVSNINGTVTVTRTVTNVGKRKALYHVSVVEPSGVSIQISPKVLSFNHVGQKRTFLITLRSNGGKGVVSGEYVAGSYTWSDGTHVVRSPVIVSVL